MSLSVQKLNWFCEGHYAAVTRRGDVLGRLGLLIELVKSVLTLRFGAFQDLFRQAWRQDPTDIKEGLRTIFLEFPDSHGAIEKAKMVFNDRFPRIAFPSSRPSSHIYTFKTFIYSAMASLTTEVLQTLLRDKENLGKSVGFCPLSFFVLISMILPGLSPSDQKKIMAKIYPSGGRNGDFVEDMREIIQECTRRREELHLKISNVLAIKRWVKLNPNYETYLTKCFGVNISHEVNDPSVVALIAQKASFRGKFSAPMDQEWKERIKSMYAFRLQTSPYSGVPLEGVCLDYKLNDRQNSGFYRIWLKPVDSRMPIVNFLGQLNLQGICQEIRNIPLPHRLNQHPHVFYLPKTKIDVQINCLPLLKQFLGVETIDVRGIPHSTKIDPITQKFFMEEPDVATVAPASPEPVIFNHPFVGIVMNDDVIIGASVIQDPSGE